MDRATRILLSLLGLAVAWFVFTAFGALGLWWWFRGRVTAAAVALTAYSISGLIGLGHYTVPGATSMAWWRQAHVVADIVLGLSLAAFAVTRWRAARLARA